ncbi:hypothetical protein B0H16DRAFT_1728711 [Mycena metata]|uniref:Uncharacterized protein n=1 Tax=Mycena metata TaxID=1033252 RepID=A0AAD7IG75_9AGAR|nr:hypothetical protein B0H16DRAFT_1728711 [Mycena metata]
MMKAAYILAGITSLATLVLARNCTPGLIYCGSTLTAIATGNAYQDQIDHAPFAARVVEVDKGQSDLFFCQGGASGVISYVASCAVGQCVDGGSGKNDHCK